MRTSILPAFCVCALSAFGQVSFGVKAGVPITDPLHTMGDFSRTASEAKRYTVGAAVEMRLPHRLTLELDALYKRIDFRVAEGARGYWSLRRTTSNSWEFPLLVKYRFKRTETLVPFVNTGASFHFVRAMEHSIDTFYALFPGQVNYVRDSNHRPYELSNPFNAGFAAGGGVEIRGLPLRVSPELRYTRWGRENFSGAISTQLNQVEFLLGLTF